MGGILLPARLFASKRFPNLDRGNQVAFFWRMLRPLPWQDLVNTDLPIMDPTLPEERGKLWKRDVYFPSGNTLPNVHQRILLFQQSDIWLKIVLRPEEKISYVYRIREWETGIVQQILQTGRYSSKEAVHTVQKFYLKEPKSLYPTLGPDFRHAIPCKLEIYQPGPRLAGGRTGTIIEVL